jgi:hypoxanthine phosphoribosyltransferase
MSSLTAPSLGSVTIRGDRFVPYITRDKLHERVRELAEAINTDFRDRKPIFICVLNGAFMFFADLIRRIHIDCEVDFMKLSSYSERKISSGQVTLLKDLNCQVEDRHIVIVEDIVDTGLSIDYMKNVIAARAPASVSIVSLLHKPDCAQIHHDLEYIGFEIPPRFVIGYGLDYAQQARNLPEIYILADDAPASHDHVESQ